MMDGGGGDSDLLGGVSSDAGSGSTAVAVDVAGEVPSKPGALGLMDQMMQASVSGVAGKSSAGPSLLSMRQQQQQSPAGEALPGKSMASGSTNAESLMEPEASSFDDWESVPTPMAPSSSSAVDKMAAIDALAEMDLAAENEDWEDFADSTTQVEPAPLEASTSIQQEAVASSSSSIGGGGGDLIITASAAASSGESGIFGDLTAALPQGDEPAILDIPPQSLPTAAEVGAPPSTGHETPQTQGGGQDDWTDFGMSAAAAHGDEPALDGVLPRPPVQAPPQPIQLGEDQEEEAGCEDDDWGDFEAHPTSSAEGAFPPPPPPADEDQSTEQQANDQGSGSANAAADDAPDDWGDFAAAGDGVSEGSKEGEDEPAAREEEEVPLDPFSALVSGGDEEKVPAVSVEPLPAAAGPNPDSCSLNELRDILVSKELLEVNKSYAHTEPLIYPNSTLAHQEAKLVEEAVESESAGSLQVQKVRSSVAAAALVLFPASLSTFTAQLTILSWRKAAASPASGTSVLLAMKTRLGAIDAAAADAFADAFIDGQESLCSHAARDFEGALCRLRGARRSATLFLILRQASHAKQTDLWRSCITIVHEHLSRLEEFANDLRAASPACVAEVRGQETSRAFVEAVGKMVALETEIRASALQARHTGLPAEFPAAKLHDLKEFLVDSAGFSWETLPLTSDANADPPLPEATCCVSWQRATDPLRHGAAVGSVRLRLNIPDP